MTRDEEITALEAKLVASQAMGGGYADRVKAIVARLAELRDEAADNA